jgi:ornithine cyclodeaminase/alanine dehydrogenase-like protein (mu-crystallin family)
VDDATGSVRYLEADEIFAACRPAAAVAALRAALASGLDLGRDPARQGLDAENGQLLLMPSSLPSDAGVPAALGVKVLTVAGPSAVGAAARIQGLYLMFDGVTLAPSAILDGPALTTLRTPAVSVAAVLDRLLGDNRPLRVAVFGAGPQAFGHVRCLEDTLTGVRALAEVRYLVRRPEAVSVPDLLGADTGVLESGGSEAESAVRRADVIICATTAAEPLFPSAWVRDEAVVIAVGSHSPAARELPGELMGRAGVVVEDRATAVREAGDVVLAVAERALSETDLIPMAEVVRGRELPSDRPVVFKSVGMAWEDLVVARAVLSGPDQAFRDEDPPAAGPPVLPPAGARGEADGETTFGLLGSENRERPDRHRDLLR